MQRLGHNLLVTGMLSAGFLLAGGVEPPLVRADPGQTARQRLRRTPAVEVFEKWKDSVVYVTGPVFPVASSDTKGVTLEEFFDLPGMGKPEQSVGTGFVVHESGYVVTNAHAAERIIDHQVVLSDGKKYAAELVASIREEDLALLKVDAGRPLSAVQLAPSGDLLIGETVIVIANPYGLMYTCTTGVVSAVGRQTNLLDVKGVTLEDMIQTDAGINPGSSGGPWFNVLGEVIGLTASMKRDSQNIGFAVSVASLRKLLPTMLNVERRYGITTGFTLPADGPCRVTTVEPDSPAARAGIRAGDAIVKLADQPVPTVADFHLALVGRRAGETLPVELLRGQDTLAVSLTPGRRPKPDGAALLRKKLGLVAAPLGEETVKSMLLRSPRALAITVVEPGFYDGVEHRPEPGDVLARIRKIRPRDLDHVGLILEDLEPGQRVPMVVLRHRDGQATRTDVSFVLPKRSGEE